MRRYLVAVICLASFCLAGSASGANFNYDFSAMGYAAGQALEGVTIDAATFTSEDGSLRYDPLHGAGLVAGYAATADIYITFSTPVSNLTATGGDGGLDDDAFSLYLYEYGTDNFLGRYDTPVFGGPAEPEWYTLNVPVSNVGRVVFDEGNSGILPGNIRWTGGLILTEFGYQTGARTIPAPGAILLGTLGTGLVGWMRRRRTL